MSYRKASFIAIILTMALAFLVPTVALAEPAVKYTPDPLPWDIVPEKTALIILDPQNVFDPANIPAPSIPCFNFETVIENINRLAAACRENNILIIVTRHVYDVDGKNCGRLCDFSFDFTPEDPNDPEVLIWHLLREDNELSELTERLNVGEKGKNIKFVEKSLTFSAFSDGVLEQLQDRGIDTVLITGFNTQYCAVTSTRHGHDLGYKVIFITDACDGPNLPPFVSEEEAIIPMSVTKTIIHTFLSIAVADVIDTDTAIWRINGE